MACECGTDCDCGNTDKAGRSNLLPDVIADRVRELVPPDCSDEDMMAAIQEASNEYNDREQKKYAAILRAELWAQEK